MREGYDFEKSRIQETPTLSTDADSRNDTNLKRLRDLSFLKKFRSEKFGGSSQVAFEKKKKNAKLHQKILVGIKAIGMIVHH